MKFDTLSRIFCTFDSEIKDILQHGVSSFEKAYKVLFFFVRGF